MEKDFLKKPEKRFPIKGREILSTVEDRKL
jgi:hypothetical protein